MKLAEFQLVLAAQIDGIEQTELQDCIEEHLVSPRLEERGWDYGEPGQTFPCWICLEDRCSNTVIAYCDGGFGPVYPWGFLSIDGENTSMGIDAQWFLSLEDAIRNSPLWRGENPVGYEVD